MPYNTTNLSLVNNIKQGWNYISNIFYGIGFVVVWIFVIIDIVFRGGVCFFTTLNKEKRT